MLQFERNYDSVTSTVRKLHLFKESTALFVVQWQESHEGPHDELKHREMNSDEPISYIVQHINRELWSLRIWILHHYVIQHIKGVLESVVNCIPRRQKIWWCSIMYKVIRIKWKEKYAVLSVAIESSWGCKCKYSYDLGVSTSSRVCWNWLSPASLGGEK